MAQANEELSKEFKQSYTTLTKIRDEYTRNIVGQKDLMVRLLIVMLTKGHILLEGVPGLAKTRSINMIAKAISASFNRIQFTPDLLPADIIGNLIFNPKDAKYYTKKGPVFANFVLADEINRSPAKVQSALLEAMQERQVTIGGDTYKLPVPFIVFATQNPIEQEGTYPLPEAQVDRFLLKTVISYPTYEEEVQIMDLVEFEEDVQVNQAVTLEDIVQAQAVTKNVKLSSELKQYIAKVIFATRYPERYGLQELSEVIAFGASPRGALSFMKVAKAHALLSGRDYVIPEDIKQMRFDVLRHRLMLTYEAEADGMTQEQVIDKIFETIQVP